MNLKVSVFYLKKQKSFIPKKKFLSRCQYQNKKALFTDSIFPKVLAKLFQWGKKSNSQNSYNPHKFPYLRHLYMRVVERGPKDISLDLHYL